MIFFKFFLAACIIFLVLCVVALYHERSHFLKECEQQGGTVVFTETLSECIPQDTQILLQSNDY